MIRRSLSAVFALLVTTPLLAAPAGQQTLFNFVRPADVVQVATTDAILPQYNAEQTAEGEVLRRVTFNPGRRAQPAFDSANRGMGLVAVGDDDPAHPERHELGTYADVTVQSSNGKTLTSRVDLPAGPAQTLLLPLKANSPHSQGMRAGPPMPMTLDGPAHSAGQ